MGEVKRKRRTHEEAVAFREACLKAKHEKALLREAKKAEREKRNEERKSRIKTTPTKKVESPVPKYVPYKGKLQVGDTVAARFAGKTVFGILSGISNEASQEFMKAKGVEAVALYKIKGFDRFNYPVRLEQIIAVKGTETYAEEAQKYGVSYE